MFELKFVDLEALKAKASTIQKLKRERDKNKEIYTTAFEQLMENDGVQAVLSLKEDNIKFENIFSDPKIKLEREYGIKGGRFVHYITQEQEDTEAASAEIVASNSSVSTEEEFDDVSSATEAGTPALVAPVAQINITNASVKNVKVKGIRTDNMVIEIMKWTDNIGAVYESFANQIVELGNSLVGSEE